jgi:hypothetical protein
LNIKRIKYQKTISQLLQILEHVIYHPGKIRISKHKVVKYKANHDPKCGLLLSGLNLRESTPGLLLDKTVNLDVILVHLLKPRSVKRRTDSNF